MGYQWFCRASWKNHNADQQKNEPQIKIRTVLNELNHFYDSFSSFSLSVIFWSRKKNLVALLLPLSSSSPHRHYFCRLTTYVQVHICILICCNVFLWSLGPVLIIFHLSSADLAFTFYNGAWSLFLHFIWNHLKNFTDPHRHTYTHIDTKHKCIVVANNYALSRFHRVVSGFFAFRFFWFVHQTK